ncbi:MAG: polysaccharide biosynthesis C-terminal domain-containing protein, partial [Actinomycetota bacterium]|nr:polysaccharide biosynthesis C-terminal domain-containing protein [Actinomycetota bacterium]
TGFVLSMTGRPGINFVNSAVAVALYIGLGIAVVPAHGAVGIAVVDSIVTALINSVRVIEAKLLVGIHPFGKSLLKPALASGIAATLLLLWTRVTHGTTLQGCLGVVATGGVYVLVLKMLGVDPEERLVWLGIKRRLRALVGLEGNGREALERRSHG